MIERGALGAEVDTVVDVHGHHDDAVADDLHDDAWVDAEREQQRDAGVAQAVERDPADAMLVAQLTEPAGEIAGFKWCAPGVLKV